MEFFSLSEISFKILFLYYFVISESGIYKKVLKKLQIKTNLYAFYSSTLLQLFQWGKKKSRKINVQALSILTLRYLIVKKLFDYMSYHSPYFYMINFFPHHI
ncbi:hypothetical protein BpHYR1_011359 [Brachionus plicatilis]|uniref:Uncharacterized protein n=1 Tax=Brachionus plicatilis TaxID=10195 RepID=A0A3M7SME7_BRAPC|nr:hypothetical protein BpHYR1_011359 [Brachionus plicatilis]